MNTKTAFPALFALLLAATGCQQLAPIDRSHPATLQQGLGPGDRLQVTVFQQEELSGEFALDAQGALSMPLIGRIEASGLTMEQVRLEIINRLQPDYLRDPSVTIARLSLRPVYLLGEVQRPGSYEHSEELSVAKAVALAGGFTYRASKQRISIRRVGNDGQESEFRVDMNTPVLGGDLINIPERFF